MTKKEIFIKIIEEEIFNNSNSDIINKWSDKELNLAFEFFEELKINKTKSSNIITENGAKLLSWMQENHDNMNNLFTANEAAEGLFTSGRSISGSMRKLVNDGYVEKVGKNPVQYSLTEFGINYKFDN